MTTVVIDCENKKVYSDRVTTNTRSANVGVVERWVYGPPSIKNSTSFKLTDKVYYASSGMLVTGSGRKDTIEGFCDHPHSFPDAFVGTTVFLLCVKGDTVQVIKYSCEGKRRFRHAKWKENVYTKNNGWIVTGSGAEYAKGALYAGVSPEEAIKAASMLDPFTGHEVQCTSIPNIGETQ